MFATLAIAFAVIPIVEIAVLLRVGRAIGGFETVLVVIAMAMAGASLARHQGLWAMRKLQEAMATGREIGQSLVESAFVLVAAVLMITPGFVTDAVGLLLLVPPVRRVVAGAAGRALAKRVAQGQVHMYGSGFGVGFDNESPPRRGFPPGVGRTGPSAGGGDDGSRGDADPPPPGVIDV